MLQHADDCKNPSFAETAYESSLPVSLPHLEAGHGIKSRTFFSEPFFATMGDLWRSEEMQLVQLFVQVEAARDTVDELGNMGVIQFRDVRCSLTTIHVGNSALLYHILFTHVLCTKNISLKSNVQPPRERYFTD